MFIVKLDNIKVFAPVGVYSQEQILLNELCINIAVAKQDADINQLPFIDYTILYDMVTKVCAIPTPYLEDILQKIYKEIKVRYENVLINIEITKKHPPVSGMLEHCTVAWKEF